jgi:uncharacterized protein (DUF2237 family)
LDGKAPKVILEACHERALEFCELSDLIANRFDEAVD